MSCDRHDDRPCPLAGERMLLVDIHQARALRSWASRLSGTWTAIWSPSKVGVEGRADQRVQLDRLALRSAQARTAWMPRRWGTSVRRAGFEQHRPVFADHLVEDVPDFLALLLPPTSLALLQGHRQTLGIQTRVDERLEQFGAPSSSEGPHWCSFNSGPVTITERPE